MPLCKIENTADFTQPDGFSAWEQPLADALLSILTLPFADGPARGYSNLKNMLLLNGFSRQKIRVNGSFDTETLRRQCFEFYGKNIAEQYFAGFSYDSICSICKWKTAAPEQYALLCVFTGLSVEELFGAEIRPGPNPVLKQILEYEQREVSCKKVDLARLMGISSFQLDSLTKKYGIAPFWTQRNNRRTETIALQLTSEEKQKVSAAVSLCGGGSAAAFVRTILLREAGRILNG
ncbi:MAG: hypothetical protein K2O18_05180 [Oscillospiraceae bacterium]|nr:hypothetical protein [Oscillospiraceae bacterium]